MLLLKLSAMSIKKRQVPLQLLSISIDDDDEGKGTLQCSIHDGGGEKLFLCPERSWKTIFRVVLNNVDTSKIRFETMFLTWRRGIRHIAKIDLNGILNQTQLLQEVKLSLADTQTQLADANHEHGVLDIKIGS
ncbi:hypothetical protein ACFE04_020990 [Oxalis oulophora]